MKRAAAALKHKEEEALNEAKRLANINKAAAEEGGDVEMEHINLDDDGPTSGEGGVKTTTTPPNKGGGDVTEEMRTVKKARKERKKARKENAQGR